MIFSNGAGDEEENDPCCRCSIGVASLQQHQPETGEQLTTMADKALYAAKAYGRNRVRGFLVEDTIRYGKLGGLR